MLKELFEMQKQLNDYVFQKQNLKAEDGTPLTMDKLIEAGKSDDIGVNSDVNKWLGNYLTALKDENAELKDELPWKWWSKDKLDMQNIRVEIVDQLHFWLSLSMTAGMTAEDVYYVYKQKNQVNIDRQNKGYNKASKTEDDNRGIKV